MKAIGRFEGFDPMTDFIDLHTHTTASDGTMGPVELVRHAKACGLKAIAITDHDTLDGVEEALKEGGKEGIEVVPGVEISVEFKPEMHLLGYFFGNTHKNIEPLLKLLRESRERRNPKIVNKLNELGFSITMAEVEAEAKGNVVGRPHIAKVLLDKGYVKNIQEAFQRFLASGRPAFEKKSKLNPEEGIQEILKAGGVPVLAHPIHLYLSWSQLDSLLGELKSFGLKGIETYYVDNTPADTGKLMRLAIKYDLLMTGGSDFHGSFKPDIRLGKGKGNLKIPYELLEKLRYKNPIL